MSSTPSNRYQWQKQVDGDWVAVDAASLPEWIKRKKSVLWASRGMELTRQTPTGEAEHYRLRITPERRELDRGSPGAAPAEPETEHAAEEKENRSGEPGQMPTGDA